MLDPVRKRATYEDLCNLPENVTGEIIDGELVVAPRPAGRHVHAVSGLGSKVTAPYQFGEGGGPCGWIIYHQPEVHFAATDIYRSRPCGLEKRKTHHVTRRAPFYSPYGLDLRGPFTQNGST